MTEASGTNERIQAASEELAIAEFVLDRGIGLHARPSLMFTKLARSFPCSIEMEVDGSGLWLNAKSIVKVLAARAREGSTLRVSAHGVRAGEAVRALKDLVEDGFGEGRPHVGLS
jgi:phosphocarrier protein